MKRQPCRYKYYRTSVYPHIVSMESSPTGATFTVCVILRSTPLTTHSTDTTFELHVPVQTTWRADL